jgi:hypothetical protein
MNNYLRRQRLEFAKFDAFINSFTPYLENVNKSSPIQRDIIGGGDCFFHSLEYAIGNVGLYHENNDHVRKTRLNIVNSLIRRVGRGYMVEGSPLYTYGRSKKWAEDIITREAAIYAKKCLFIISYNPPDETKNVKSDENQGRVTLIQPFGLELNATNIIFIVNKHNAHFVTFKTRRLGVNQKLITPVIATEHFIKGLNDFLLYNPTADISTIQSETRRIHKINLFSFLLTDLIPYLNREEPPLNNKPVSNSNLESTLAQYISNEAIRSQEESESAQYISNQAIRSQEEYNAKKESTSKKTNAKKLTLKERRENERKERNAKRITKRNVSKQPKNNTNSNRAIAELLAREERELANEQFARSLRK